MVYFGGENSLSWTLKICALCIMCATLKPRSKNQSKGTYKDKLHHQGQVHSSFRNSCCYNVLHTRDLYMDDPARLLLDLRAGGTEMADAFHGWGRIYRKNKAGTYPGVCITCT